MENREIKKVAIVLSGGMSRGAAELAFVKHIVEKIGYERLVCLSGSSIGAINCYSLSVKNYDRMIDVYNNLDVSTIRQFTRKIKNDLFIDVFNIVEGKELYVPTYVTGTKMIGLDCYYFCLNNMTREDMKMAINVSTSFPGINGPQKFLHHLWVDGGTTDNVPVLPVTHFDPDMVIILHCYPKYYPPIDLYNKLREDAVVVDIDVTLELPPSIQTFSLTKTDFQQMTLIAGQEGKKFVDEVFQDFDIKNVKERCYKYTMDRLEKRRLKGGGLMGIVDVLNALYVLKEDIA